MTDTIGNIAAILLVVVLMLTALADFMRHEKALETTDRLRIPARMVPVLGAIKVAAAAGVLLGRNNVRLAELTGACLVLYFAIATMTHLRVRDGIVRTAPAVVMFAASAAYLLAQVAQ